MEANKGTLESLYPGIKTVTVETGEEALAGLDSHKCGATVLFEGNACCCVISICGLLLFMIVPPKLKCPDAFNNYKSDPDGKHCNKIRVGNPLCGALNVSTDCL